MALAEFIEQAAIPRRLRAMAILRVGIASITSLLYLMHIQQRHFLWGANGEIDYNYYAASGYITPLSLYRLSGNATWVEILFWTGLCVSVMFALGIFPRLLSIVFLMFTASLYDRNYVSLDGGQNVVILMSLYLCLVDSGAYLSVSRDWSITQRISASLQWLVPYANVLHNAGILLIAGQICILYFWSGFYKISGHKWQDGTAIYYVMRTNEFQWPGFSSRIYNNAYLVLALTYTTIVFQQSFPVLMWVPKAKPYIFSLAVCFHIGIAVFMGLAMFSATMIVADLAIFSDEFYGNVSLRLHSFSERIRAAFERKLPEALLER